MSTDSSKMQKDDLSCFPTEDGRSMTSFYYCSVNHKSGLQSSTFLKLSYIFLIHQNVPHYVISFEVYDGVIGQKIL